jgi:hypothetical protein
MPKNKTSNKQQIMGQMDVVTIEKTVFKEIKNRNRAEARIDR